MGLDADLGIAYAKSQMAASSPLPLTGRVFLSVSDAHKSEAPEVGKLFADLGFELVATGGTAAVLEKAGLKVRRIFKLAEGRPNALDLLKKLEKDGKVSEDDHVRMAAEVQKATDQTIADIDKMLTGKEKEILTV